MGIPTLAVVILATGLSATAMAGEVTCESRDRARTECEMDTHGVVKIVRQLSKAPCTEGVSWGLSKHAVWVEQGCRAVFANDKDDASMAATPRHGLQRFNATCPGNLTVHGDDGGPVYINGQEASLKKFNDSYYEARGNGTTLSISKNPDETLSVSYTGPGGANGICQTE